ncbi:MAG: glycosyltransferase [Saprospiraceae bacterium]|nr:glycosyltransferase [Saprospiraceae bacterium]
MLDIVIPSYNNSVILSRCVMALELAAPGRHRIVIVDDGSDPPHRDQLQTTLQAIDRDLHLLQHEHNQGFKEAILTAMAFCDAQYVLLLNDDTVPTRDFDLKLLGLIEDHDDVKGVGPVSNHPTDLFQYRPELREIDFNHFHGPDAMLQRFRELQPATGATEVPFLTGMCLLLDRAVFEQVGYFDGAYEHGYFEDLELCCRIREMGYRLMADEDCFVYHVGHETYKHKATDEKRRIIMRNFRIYESNWAHLPEHQDLLDKMAYAGKEHPI